MTMASQTNFGLAIENTYCLLLLSYYKGKKRKFVTVNWDNNVDRSLRFGNENSKSLKFIIDT